MRITDMNWMQVEEYLKQDDRAVLPLGSTEQHAYLSLGVDSILASRVAEDAAAPLAVLGPSDVRRVHVTLSPAHPLI